jgi:hypothetical protein
MNRSFALLVSGLSLATLAVPAAAAVTQIVTPDNAYVSATNLLGVPNPSGPNVSAVADLYLQVNFSTILDPRVVGDDWSTWGSPPDTEDAAPSIFYSSGATSVEFAFSKRLSIWGFEAEGNPFDDRTFTVDYYDGANLLGSVVRVINGNGGARLLAATYAGGFTRAVVSTDTDFAIAQLRYELAREPRDIVPEPATWALMILGFGLVGFAARRRASAARIA